MPTDYHGVTHAGALGLFDDDQENASSIARAERHEIADLEKEIRREERRTKRKLRKEDKAAQRELPRPASWLHRLFSSGKDSNFDSDSARLVDEKLITDKKKTAKMPTHVTTEWTVVRRPVASDAMYTAQDVDPVDSPFLRECGMVKVKSDDAGGCHVVPKSTIQKSE